MPNTKKRKLTRKQRKQAIESIETKKVEKLVSDNYPKIIDDDENATIEQILKPGTVVKIKNIQTKPELNGRFTIVTKPILKNGRVPVSVGVVWYT